MGILEGKAGFVTGGGRGIGRGHCLHLAEQGAAVVVNDVDLTEAQKEVDEGGDRNGQRRSDRKHRHSSAFLAHRGPGERDDDARQQRCEGNQDEDSREHHSPADCAVPRKKLMIGSLNKPSAMIAIEVAATLNRSERSVFTGSRSGKTLSRKIRTKSLWKYAMVSTVAMSTAATDTYDH